MNPEKHASPALPLVVHFLAAGAGGHVIVPHWPDAGSHATSHRHELVQLMSPHAPIPMHVASHGPEPHVMSPHAPRPEHVALQ